VTRLTGCLYNETKLPGRSIPMALQSFRALHDDCNPDCVIDVIQKPNCTLTIGQTLRAQIVGIDCDKCSSFASDDRRPDFIILFAGGAGSTLRWLVVEMKGTAPKIGTLVEQFQAGVNAVESDHRFKVSGSSFGLTPLLLHEKSGVKTADFRNVWVRMGGRKFPLLQKRCGVSLARLFRVV